MPRCPPAPRIGKAVPTGNDGRGASAEWTTPPGPSVPVVSDLSGDDFSAFAAGQTLRLPGAGHSMLHYQDRGRGPAVLLGHAYLGDSSVWEPQIQALSRQYRVIAPDLWGHGASGPLPCRTQRLEDLAEQMLELMDALDIPEFAVVGLSAGNLWSTELALRAPDRVRALVMMGPCPAARMEKASLRYLGMLDSTEAEGRITPDLARAIVPLFFRQDTGRATPQGSELASALAAMPADRLRDSVVPLGRMLFGRIDGPDRLARLDPATTLLLYGDADALCPHPEMQRMAALIGCEAVQVPGAGHLSGLDRPEFVNRSLLQWLERTLR